MPLPKRNTMRFRQIPFAIPAAVLFGLAASSFAAPPVTLAPLLGPIIGQNIGGAPLDANQDSVFQWTEVPQNQQVPLTRAVFDQSGYQLYDTAGETIVIPFTNNNLYVMKFAPSSDGTTYFVNTGDAPVLYIPSGGYLENASVPGARWYPFSEDFHPAHPVYLGVAPSWGAFASIGWAPDVVVRGGYWGRRDFISGGIFLPSVGLSFNIGGRSYDGWQPYHDYVVAHPDHFRFGDAHVIDRGRVFRGSGPGYTHGRDRDYHAGPDDRDYHSVPGNHGARHQHTFRGARGTYHHDGR